MRRALAASVVTVVSGALLTGCTLASDGPSTPSSAASSPSVDTSTSIPPFSPTAGTSAPSGSSASATSATPSGSPRAAACALPGTQVTALRGSGAQQQQFATIRITNTGSAPCSVTGVPTLQLLTGGTAAGSPSRPSAAARTITLSAGGTASALAHGPSTCNAPVSDSARLTLPGDSRSTSVLLPMRVCALVVDPLVSG